MRLLTATIILLISTTVAGCRFQQDDMRQKMRSAYSETASLFRYVWEPHLFKDPKNEKAIIASLDRLIAEFHDVESLSAAAVEEPGFKVTLQTNQSVLKDIRKRFAGGQKDYANWRLRALTANCTACHSRFEVSNDFIGEMPWTSASSFEAKLARAEFLLATRQFAQASKELFRLAESVSAGETGESETLEALKLWLVSEVRVKDRPADAAAQLERLIAQRPMLAEQRPVILEWHADLLALADEGSQSSDYLARAIELLVPVDRITTLDEEEQHLVKTLKATALLHSYLQTVDDEQRRRQGFFRLALGYQKIPIPSFELFQELYLEHCIREFPGTLEAREAFVLLQRLVEFESTGSGGLHLDPADAARLYELREIAHSSGV